MNTQSIPLCVDLDGTLLKTDTLHELVLCLIKHQPWQIFWLPIVLFQCLSQGKQYLKNYLAERVTLDPSSLPYNQQLLAFLKQEKESGRTLLLVTGCYQKTAQAIADHLGLFSGVIASNEAINLTGSKKADHLLELYGKQGFDYAGNSTVDEPVWRESRKAILVNASSNLNEKWGTNFNVDKIFDERKLSFLLLVKGLRLHQWAKNALIFLPALTSHQFFQTDTLTTLLFAFLAFGCCASFNYVINDLLDLEDDRKHHRKQNRPFASGAISIPLALVLAAGLLMASVLFSQFLSLKFGGLLIVYFIATNLYSFRLKKIPILDVALLAGLYTMRVLAGAVAIQTEPSFWLIAFSAFLFFSLAIVKRLSELLFLKKKHTEQELDAEVRARGYVAEDIPTLQGLGTGSAIAAVLVLALYINSDAVRDLYHSPNQLWLLCPVLLLWLGRAWLVTGRGNMHDDPVVFALKDKVSWIIFIAGAAVMVSATFY